MGVNYMALDEERRRQELLLRELREIEEEIASPNLRGSKLPSLASVVGVSNTFERQVSAHNFSELHT